MLKMRQGPYHFVFYPLLVLLLLLQLFHNFGHSCAPRSGYNRRKPTKPLYLKQRVPDTEEFSLDASGSAKGKITRNSSKFNTQLVSCFISDIVFKDEEGTGADRLMTKKCREKLKDLARRVQQKWHGKTKLRVIEAWDEDGSHSTHSLHYEGRAVDITTSDLDRSKYPELGRLAVQSGFDWVYYESQTHIHASVREDDGRGWRGCFNSNASVRLENGSHIPIKDVKVGQKVQGIDDSGEITYSEVLMFLDFNPWLRQVPFIIIETESPYKRLTMTKNHLIFYKNNNVKSSKVKAKIAGLVKQGDYVLVQYREGAVLSRVRSVSTGNRDGMIAPLTQHGNLFVDDVLVSCYSDVKDHELAHTAFSPVRLVRRFAPSLFKNMDNSDTQKGMHWFPSLLISLNNILGIAEYA